MVLCSVYFGDCSKLVVILMDGFRWDYFDNIDMPGFADMAKDGVKAEYIVPDYPSISYPNFYSIMTGMITAFTMFFPLLSIRVITDVKTCILYVYGNVPQMNRKW